MWTGWLVSSPGVWHVFGLVFLHIGQEDNDKGGKKKWSCKGPAFEILGRDRGRSPKNPRWMVDRSEFGGSFSYQAAPFLVFAYIWVMSWIEAKQIWWQCLVELRVAVFLLNSTGFGASICWSKPRWCTVYSRAVPKPHPAVQFGNETTGACRV